jgi:glycerol-3-phosphate dehydrogenase
VTESSRSRAGLLARLATTPFDVLVIGGGITGAGVALDAAARGLSVALVEQGDFAQGTSSRSTKLVHGGLRYLPMLDLPQVREDLEERGLLLQNAVHLVRPLPFVLPLYAAARFPLGLRLPPILRAGLSAGMACGLWAYDLLARGQPVRRHRRLAPEAARALVPPLRLEGLRRAFLYYDAVTDDARLTVAVLRTAVRRGAVALNYVRATAFVTDRGRVTGAQLVDRLTGRVLTASARTTVNATGVWAESVARLAGAGAFRIRRSKGVHLVFPNDRIKMGRAALVLPETDDGRIAFVVPWQGTALIGTTDTEWTGEADDPTIDPGDVAYLVDHASRFLTVPVAAADALGAYAGLRPLLSTVTGSKAASARLSRRHATFHGAEGFVSIVGGKLTTYRRMAEDVLNIVTGRPEGTPSPTRSLALDGALDLRDAIPALRARARRLGLARATAVHLIRSYGTGAAVLLDRISERPALGEPLASGLPHVAAEVITAVHDEWAVTLADVLMRRTRLAHLLPRQAVEIAPRIAALMAADLGWSQEEQAEQVAGYARSASSLGVPRRLAPA